ncbi:PREDICTED: uncharacterized protein LOC109588481 [Amphimedon queenslandica]|nr:PREDICTED: uncharacterized protein LOC109588481 [Amphimedon queenslandica]|eukprot:XP_019860202.1 PREDICTED: uncharacterized protein LOC109588481 [Amphimedon queenslandica]
MPPTNISSTDDDSVPIAAVIVPTLLIMIFFLVVLLVCIVIVVWYRKKSKKFDINKANELSVAPNAGYGLVAIANTSVTQNNEGMYERIDEYLYEPIDDKIVQQKEEDTPIVGDSVVDNIPIANCPAYATSPITAQTSSPTQGETNEEQDVDEYENMS